MGTLIELQPRTIFRCDKCWQYSPRIKCKFCFYPSPAFPQYFKLVDKEKPKDFDEYKKWDAWYLWRYLLVPPMDEEEKYSIGSEWVIPYYKSYK